MKKLVILTLALCISIGAYAQQKFGHLNTGNLLESLPEVALADSLLMKYQDSLAVKGQELVKTFEKDYTAYIDEVNKGLLPPVQQQQKEAALQKQQETIEAYKNEMETKIGLRRQAYLKPILSKVDEEIRKIGKENNYAFIFDTSTGTTLFALESEDLTQLVLKRLGKK
ncbi:MAG: OmpH family outer membrane protein [Saprospiraceae bacterium]